MHSPDRLARNYAYQVLLLDKWRQRGVEVVFLNRPLGQSPEDDLLLQVQGIIAEYERAKNMKRSQRGKKHPAQSGSLMLLSSEFLHCRRTRDVIGPLQGMFWN